MLSCNKCTHKLTDSKGCVFCDDFKRNYLTITDDNLDIKAVKVGNNALRCIANDLAKLEVELNSSDKYNPVLSRELQVVTKNLTMVMDTIRKFEKGEHEDEKDASFTEQKAIFIEWLDNLPIMLRNDVLRIVRTTFKDELAGQPTAN